MLDLSKIFGKKNRSKDTAKDRLKLVLVHDRANVSPEFLEKIKDEIMQVIAKYVDVSDGELDINITTAQSEDGKSSVPAITANIPIKSIKHKA
ncbi:MAG: cell division topological specificity factor MinE [Clostridia bacterium]|nr:cell division topological specificity factor MinE [Oscillospiraceae bacterium]MBQ7959983.1 cell division topological specificity factor MinE [Clostridia bacterium]